MSIFKANSKLIFVLSGPSGAGKTSLINRILAETTGLKELVSHTTRKKREDEKDGVDYHFVSEATFEKMKKNGLFIETVDLYNNRYGTTFSELDNILSEGMDVIVDVDPNGALNIRQKYLESVLIFILPPSLKILKERLSNRATENLESVEYRFSKSKGEIKFINNYDYIIFNSVLDDAVFDLKSILDAERLKIKHNLENINLFNNRE